MSVSIVVPVYNALEYARGCIDSIYAAKTALPFEVIVVDNGSNADVAAWLAAESSRRPNFRFLRFDQPLGFPRAANEGACVARHELLVLLNSDTVVFDHWLDLLATALDQDRAIAAPVTNRYGHDTQMDVWAPAVDVALGREYAAGIHHRAVVEEPQRLVFFCVMIRRSLWSELTGLDETYGPGNYDDDDFCLRARLAGYRLAVARNVFVFHHERRTFDENRIDHGEAMARNQVIFCERAAAWSKAPPRHRKPRPVIRDVAVIVPAPRGPTQELRDSLASLANQTVTGFDVFVVSPQEVSSADFPDSPRFTAIRGQGNLPALLNAGIAAARGRRIAFLPAGDIYYPFHLEVLANAAAEAVYSAWVCAAGDRRGAPEFEQAAPGKLRSGDWAPLVCWMHSAPHPFDESLDSFCGWEWVMRLGTRPRYVRRVTCEKTARACSFEEAERVVAAYPVADRWYERERKRFLAAVKLGRWERTLIIDGNQMERRARRMIDATKPRRNESPSRTELASAETRPTSSVVTSPAGSRPAVFLFSIIRWTDLTQRPHHFARGLAARGIPVFWVDVQLKAPELTQAGNLAIEIGPNLYYVELPGSTGDLYRLEWHRAALDTMVTTMAAAVAAFRIGEAIQLVNFPKWTPLVLRLRERFGWRIVYDCLDDQAAFGDLYRGNNPEFEPELIRESALLVTSGRALFDRHGPYHQNAVLIPNAADFNLFSRARPSGQLDRVPHPVIGFFGAFAEWLDLDWIAESARRFPAWSFVYIGREGFASPEARKEWLRTVSAPNIHVIGQVDQRTLAGYLAEFDVCTMPFRDLPMTRSMNAVKIFEYLAAGKPVVAPDLPETRPLAERGLIAVYQSVEESFRLLAEAAMGGLRDGLAPEIRRFAVENSWSRRLDDLTGAIDRCRRQASEP